MVEHDMSCFQWTHEYSWGMYKKEYIYKTYRIEMSPFDTMPQYITMVV